LYNVPHELTGFEEDTMHVRGAQCGLGVFATLIVALLAGCDQAGAPGAGFDDDGFDLCGGPNQEGCSCTPGHVIACYPEAPLTGADGEEYCVEGVRECGPDGAWGECLFADDAERYAIIGDPELCGGCDPACWKVHDCPTGRDLDEENADNVRFDLDADGIVLGGSSLNARYAWVANSPDSTVSKFDLNTGAQVGRYRVGLSTNGAGGNAPSRTAIDSRGNAYIASRAFGLQGTVTKIAGDRSYCVDRNLNGLIDTSAGGADIRAWNADECVLWTKNVGGSNGVPRAITIDASDRVWVGLFNLTRFDVLDPEGNLIRSVSVSGYPYGAAIGRDGLLWYPNSCCGQSWIQSVNTTTYAVGATRTNTSGCNGSYGIAVDTTGRVLVGGYSATGCLARYNPTSGAWQAFTGTSGYVRGVTVDAEGLVWAASHTSGFGPHWLTSWNDAGGDRHTYSLGSGGQTCGVPIGVGADFSGRIWTPCQSTSNVARLDPDTGAVDFFPTGPNPYTYSDFTGFLRATVTAPEGSYTRLYDSRMACAGDRVTFWSQLYWEAETPENTQINFVARTANSVAQLGLSPNMTLASIPGDLEPADVQAIMAGYGVANNMRYLEIRVQLRSLDGETSPVFRQMDNVFYCVCECDINQECSADCDCDEDCGG
jgi:streptogramin lyase